MASAVKGSTSGDDPPTAVAENYAEGDGEQLVEGEQREPAMAAEGHEDEDDAVLLASKIGGQIVAAEEDNSVPELSSRDTGGPDLDGIRVSEFLPEERKEENGNEAEVAGAKSKEKEEGEEEDKNSNFECNICLDVASDAVISMCGHLFCWPCLHTWLETRPNRQICPVCKAGIGKDKVVPLYGRGNPNAKDPREKPIPPRPRGQRPEPENTSGIGFGGLGGLGGGGGGGGVGGFHMSFGIGAFPFGFLATNFNLGDGGFGGANRRGATGPAEGTPQFEEEQFLHKVFLWVAFAFICWLLIA